LNASKPIAAIKPAFMESTTLTDSRGSRPIIQVNSTHATNIEITMERTRKSSQTPKIPVFQAI
jgi:hypothetical protein